MKNPPILPLIKGMLLEYRELAVHLFWLVPSALALATIQVSEPYIFKLVIDTLGSPDFSAANTAPLVAKIALWGGFVFSSLILGFVFEFAFHRLMQRQWAKVIGRGVRAFLNRPYSYHVSINNAEKIKVFNRGIDASYDATNEVVMNSLLNVFLCIGFMVLCFMTNVRVTATLLIVLPLLLILPITIGTKAHRAQKHASAQWDAVYSRAGDSLLNVLVVKLFSRIGFDVEAIQSRVRMAASAQRRVSIYWSFLEAGGQAIHLVISIAVMLTSLYFYSRGVLSIGDIVLFIAVSGKLSGPFLRLEWGFRNLVRFAADYAKYREVLDAPAESDAGSIEFRGVRDALRYEEVSFTYPQTEREVISGVSLEFRRGTKTALIGHTGSGKSTIVNLLARFYEPTHGSISIDGTDIRDFTLDSFRSRLAAVFQDTTLFNDTILHNLQYVRDGITLEEVRKACADANVLDFIDSLPEGFETLVGERGLKLSWGEKQRLAIARAILADPEILILDEATSALDSKTEKLVSEALEKLMKGRTSIIIAHRLSTIQHADQIYLLEKGQLIGSGSHAELYESSPVYKEMVDYQKHGFIE